MSDMDYLLEESGSDESTDVTFRDMLTLVLAGFIAIVILVLPHINPPGKKDKEDIVPPGNVIVEIKWPNESNTDIDLWVQAPGDVPVGYSNQSGKLFNLLRDDLGHRDDVSGINYEVAYSRGIVAGEYTVNVHLYRDLSGKLPIEITVVVSIKLSAGASAKQAFITKVRLSFLNEEITAMRFRLDERGSFVPGSDSTIFKPLRSQK